jgi:hypothetical protein
MDRQILKAGLHRELRTNLTYTVENPSEYEKCSLVIREWISQDVYIYLEEVQALRHFEFWPHHPMDIEKPASTAKRYEFIWRVPLGAVQ